MGEIKTKRTKASVASFLAAVPDARRRSDALAVKRMMEKVTGEKAEMWGPSIVGFGAYTYQYSSGKTLDWPIAGFSPRKTSLVLYLMPSFEKKSALLARLGKHKTGKSCLYINSLADVDGEVLEALVRESVESVRAEGTATAKTFGRSEKPKQRKSARA